MDLGIRGKKAIVCGSSRGLGKGCAFALADAGVSLVINGRNRSILDATAREIRLLGALVLLGWRRKRKGSAIAAASSKPLIVFRGRTGCRRRQPPDA